VKYNIIQFVFPELQNLYQWLEVEFHPLKLASRVQSSLDFIAKKDELAGYIPALQDITIMRVIKQVRAAMQVRQKSSVVTVRRYNPFHNCSIIVHSTANE